jgi:hypothetical protein
VSLKKKNMGARTAQDRRLKTKMVFITPENRMNTTYRSSYSEVVSMFIHPVPVIHLHA